MLGLGKLIERGETFRTADGDEDVADFEFRLGGRIEDHVASVLLDRHDDDLVFCTQTGFAQVVTDEDAIRLDFRFFELQFDVLGSRRQVDEIDDGRFHDRMGHARAADLIRRDHTLRASLD